MGFAAEIVVELLLIGLNALFALSEMALVSANRGRLVALEQRGVPGAAQARFLVDDPQRFLPTLQVGLTLISILSGVFGGASLAQRFAPLLVRAGVPPVAAASLALAIVALLITYLMLLLGELVPKRLALREPERIAIAAARPLLWVARIGGAIVWFLNRSSSLVLRLLGAHRPRSQSVTEEDLHALLAEGEQTGVIETEERGMIERVLRLADKPVRAIMTPRNSLAWIDRTDSPEEIAATVTAQPHSRLVICDGAVDNPVGIVLAKDLLDRLLAGKALSIAEALRTPMVMPDTVTALDALERLRTDPLGMALVMDEYGSFEGVVTAADVLQAITGEPEPAAPEAGAEEAPGVLSLDGMMPVDEVKARLGLPELPAEGRYHTLAGLLLALLRRVPQVGDRIVFGGWLFEVAGMDGRRVERVRASREALAQG